ncbi:DUF7091 family protein [Halegenticoccus tardaugens]|uniref:DUF7091 family protein n=1 Tax=Halegenticoccus tardaugens TaxID=2071624 RepID=UPI00100A80CD|nr:hypothetical protein [Halegenticoccus tardaugens]
MDDRIDRFIRTTFRGAGRRYAEARKAYREGRGETDGGEGANRFDLPRDEEGRARLVCRRYAEQRAVTVDGDGRPSCFDPDHADCRGCAEDVREGVVETW